MAVYTKVSEEELITFLCQYDIGALQSYEGIEQGVSNTNYFVTTDKGRFVLTLFEPHRVRAEDIPFFIRYSMVLEKAGVPCPRTMIQQNGKSFSFLCDRPSAIFSVLHGEGGHVGMLTSELCEKAGEVLAKMHLAAANIHEHGMNYFGLLRWKSWLDTIGTDMDQIDAGLYDLTKNELAFIDRQWPSKLPAGAIHGDYFPDNVFFEDGSVTGVIDFHFVCTDLFAYEVAIAINAWCFDTANKFQPIWMEGMMRGYNAVRPLTQAEQDSLPILLRAASLRFLLSRIEEKLSWKQGDFMKPHDPMVFEKRLRHFQSFAVPA